MTTTPISEDALVEQPTSPDAAVAYKAAVEAYVSALSDPAVAEAIAPTLTCARATPIIDLLTEAGHHDVAGLWAELHAYSEVNDETDKHRGDG
ncbi:MULTISPECIES: hypothetical protein [unclassified Rathayibacter]|uniref:hypothetical protein n=1 Tax=unclassified Rathayibacter TaxID=2609250 RepID=UPI000CE855AA|nr:MULTISPECIES: hypothetical protein [unclassified Rathayibacter]PPF14302.1 hypothetical protein C5B92_15200 [Rathayibacter sp. AY1A4]PPG79907.1 hypothetical protein C5C52_11375 [Rathayibacter sp. AY1E5]PPH31656.1 hypothetical protein C5C94_07970 [Rathayibacter sp. AY1C3]PPH65461.1 hypothetical protein C5D25_04105 [Rathayibacter sp. AY1D7]PPI29354.1 hypothetical protein C5D66_11375 [Rathayibacter sp. AY1B4]